MPLRNLLLIVYTGIFSLLCFLTADRNQYSAKLSDIMATVEANYVKPVERRKLFDAAMDGMLQGLDPYSGYMPPDEYRPFIEGIEQKFGGVGILVEINPTTKRLTVMSPLFGTPAHKAGILSGDTIMEIDGKDTEGLEIGDAVKLMKGDPHTQVKLSVLHLGEDEPVEITLTRAIIRTESVLGDKRVEGAKWDFHLQEDPRIALVRIASFGDKTADEVAEALVDDDGHYRGYGAIIIDLRGNPGGTLLGAVEICDFFLEGGAIVSTRSRDPRNDDVYSAEPGVLVPDDVPIVVLVNHYSASASEIVAACLQDHGRAKVVGERSWGKGSVQNVIEIDRGKNGAVRLTTSRYLRPSEKNIHREQDAKDSDEWGVSPNPGFEVKLTDDELKKVLLVREARDKYRPFEEKKLPLPKPAATPDGEAGDEKEKEDPAAYDDPQLRKAIEYLQQQLKGGAAKA